MTKKHLEIHSENILPIIKKWLYSDKDIFVRELVSNACDALQKVKILQDKGEIQPDDLPLKVQITIDKENRQLIFSDHGIGMDTEEVQKNIAQIAFSGAEDFVNKYKLNKEKDQFIGHFGLGFYSAYMVASKVDIDTRSYKPDAEPVFWSCDGGSEYIIETGSRKTRGTQITLHIDKDSDEFLEESRMLHILKHYCSFLPYPVYLGDTHINEEEPLWIKSPSECKDEDYLNFYRHLYPMEGDPLFWVHLNVDYPFHLKGILYFPKLQKNFDLDKSSVKLFCNRVFVSDNCKDVIPNYLMALKGVIDSPDIPLNVSRSYLQMDRTVRQLGSHISKKVSDSLSSLYRNEKERYIKAWEDAGLVVKLGILEDEKFYDRVKDILIWKTTHNEWTTVQDYLEKNREKTKDKIVYTRDPEHFTHFIDLYRQKGIDVLCAPHPLDQYVIQFLERKLSPTSFQRIDASVDEHVLDKDREKDTESTNLAEFVRSKLGENGVQVEAKSLASDALPGFVMIDESQRRMRDYMMQVNPQDLSSAMHLLDKRTFVVNTNNPLMSVIQKIDASNPELAKDLVQETYELALLSQREMDPASLNEFISRSSRILAQLAEGYKQN